MRVRIKFTKNEPVKYLGHLDIMRTFQRAFNRAQVRMTYSEGFNPHQKMAFAQPLGVGVLSRGEYLDAVIGDGQELTLIRGRLDQAMGDGFDILDVRQLRDDAMKAMAAVGIASYEIILHDRQFSLDIGKYLDQPSIVLSKKTKTGVRQVDVKQAVISCTWKDPVLSLVVRAEGEHTLKPELIVQDILEFHKIAYDRDHSQIVRQDLYTRDMVPLLQYQTLSFSSH